ncbi:3-keto-disaccharide hydrolase, partial [Alistipes shahii]
MKSNPSRTLFRTLFATGLIAASLCSCCPKHNTLTQAEIADGWQLLFDGKSLDQWKDFNGDSLTMPWHVVDGCIQAAGDGSDLSGYIVTKKQYENFILDWDWKLSYGGNSGM